MQRTPAARPPDTGLCRRCPVALGAARFALGALAGGQGAALAGGWEGAGGSEEKGYLRRPRRRRSASVHLVLVLVQVRWFECYHSPCWGPNYPRRILAPGQDLLQITSVELLIPAHRAGHPSPIFVKLCGVTVCLCTHRWSKRS